MTRMRVVQLNLAADFSIAMAEELLDRYHTLTHWSDALASGGAEVSVVQRFTSNARVNRSGVTYTFVADGGPGMLGAWDPSPTVVDAVMCSSPDVVHVNGLMFPAVTHALRRALGSHRVIVLQDHSGEVPGSITTWAARGRWREAFRCADACTFTAVDLASRWHEVGLSSDVAVIEVPEASTAFVPVAIDDARTQTGLAGEPVLLWVGRFDANKDPLTVLRGMELAMDTMPRARLCMIGPAGHERDHVERRIRDSRVLRNAVSVIGPVPHRQLPAYFSSADIFVSGSHHEGSGYALLEAMACGVTPCVTDIPAFRALVGVNGPLWAAGDATACARALQLAIGRATLEQRARVREDFDNRLSWPVIARRTLDAYSALLTARRTRE